MIAAEHQVGGRTFYGRTKFKGMMESGDFDPQLRDTHKEISLVNITLRKLTHAIGRYGTINHSQAQWNLQRIVVVSDNAICWIWQIHSLSSVSTIRQSHFHKIRFYCTLLHLYTTVRDVSRLKTYISARALFYYIYIVYECVLYRVAHNLLLEIMKYLNTHDSTLNLYCSYLANRSYRIIISYDISNLPDVLQRVRVSLL